MSRFITRVDLLGLALPAALATAGTWHLVYNHNGNPLGRTAVEIGVLYALYVGGYLFWGAIARVVGALSVVAAVSTLFVIGMFWWLSAALGPLLVPSLGVTSLGGMVAAIAWASRGGEPEKGVPSSAARGATAPTGVDVAAVAVPGILAIALALLTDVEGSVAVKALEPWALILEYAGFLGGFLFWRLQTTPVSRRIFVPSAVLSVVCVLLGSMSMIGVVVLVVLVGMPAAGTAVAVLLANLSLDSGAPSHA